MRPTPPRRPRLPVLPSNETATVKAILQLLHAHRIPAYRMNSGAAKIEGRFLRWGGTVGMADIIGVRTIYTLAGTSMVGQFLAIEVKSAKGRVTPAQQSFLDQVNAAGGRAFVARSVAEVQAALGLP